LLTIRKFILGKQHIIFPVLDVALNGVNYLFHIYVSWYLSQGDYGILNSLLSLSAILLVTGISFQIYTARTVARFGQSDRRVAQVLRLGNLFALVISIGLLVSSPALMSLTRSGFLSLIIVASTFAINVYLSIFRGFFQGKKEFLSLNVSFYIEVLSKVFFLYFLLRYFRSIELVLISIIFGMGLSLCHALYKNRAIIMALGRSVRESLKPFIRQIAAIFAANFFLYFFTSVDMIAVNFFLPDVSGVFAVVLRYSQIILFVAFSVMTVFIPVLSSSRNDYKAFSRHLKLMLVLFGLMGILAVIGYRWILPPTVDLFFDSQYSGASQYLLLGAIAYIFLVFSFLIVNIFIVLERTRHLRYLAGSGTALLILFLVFHDSISTIFIIEAIVYLGLFLVLIVDFAIHRGDKSETGEVR